MGARIEGLGTDTLVIEGVEELGGASHAVIPDRIEAGTYLVAAGVTGGEVVLEEVEPAHMSTLLDHLRRVGMAIEEGDRSLAVHNAGPLRGTDMRTEPYPGFPTDMQAQWMLLMTQAGGPARVVETIFEARFMHVAELLRMGAHIALDGGTARVEGPTPLTGAEVTASDLRASACLVLAGLAARGETVVHRVYHLDRGYERIEHKLEGLGAQVERLTEERP
jgi:UDP-N-acetylglucosamine 1-carboxyvinyltransferase